MADWGYALGKSIQAGAQAGSDALDRQMKTDAAVAAEQRAADIQIDTKQRLMAIEQAMRTRAAERFSTVVRQKMQGQPLEIAPGDPAPLTNEGMTVKPSIEDATQQALDDTLQNDPEAYMAGTGMLGSVMKERTQERQLAAREKIEQARIDSREKTEAAKLEQRDRSDNKRYEAMMARIEASANRAAGGGKGGSKSALIQNVEFMRDVLKYSPEKIESFIFDKKTISKPELTAKILSDAKKSMDDITPEQASAMADSILSAGAAAKPATPASKPAQKALPAGAKQIGTSGGKPVYQTPDGKKFIQE